MRGDRLGGPPGAFLLARAGAKWRPQPADLRAKVFHGCNSAPHEWRLVMKRLYRQKTQG
jgi:hypothetical protein